MCCRDSRGVLASSAKNKLYFGIPHPLLEEWGYKIFGGGYTLWEYRPPVGIPPVGIPLVEIRPGEYLMEYPLWEGARSGGAEF